MPKSPAELDRDIAEVLSKKGARSHATKPATVEKPYKQRVLEDAIEAVYHRLRKGAITMTPAEACEAVREMLPSSSTWSQRELSDKALTATIKRQIPDWF